MDENYNNLFDLWWWLGVGIAALLFNVLSRYLEKPIESIKSYLSRKWALRKKRKDAEFEQRVESIAKSRFQQMRLEFKVLATEVRNVQALVVYFVTAFLAVGVAAAFRYVKPEAPEYQRTSLFVIAYGLVGIALILFILNNTSRFRYKSLLNAVYRKVKDEQEAKDRGTGDEADESKEGSESIPSEKESGD